MVSFPIYYQLKAGDVSSRGKIRQENNCKPFKYFLDHVREIIHLYVPENLKASGAVCIFIYALYWQYTLTLFQQTIHCQSLHKRHVTEMFRVWSRKSRVMLKISSKIILNAIGSLILVIIRNASLIKFSCCNTPPVALDGTRKNDRQYNGQTKKDKRTPHWKPQIKQDELH